MYGGLEFIQHLLACGYPALKPLRTKRGEVCLTLETKWGGYYPSVFSRVAGVPVEDTDFSDEIMFAYGKALGRLHALSSRYVPKTRKWTHDEALDWIAAALSKYGAPDRSLAELAAVQRELGRLPVSRDTYGLVRYDFEPDNWYALDIE